MSSVTIEIIPEQPYADGVAAGKALGERPRARCEALLRGPYLRDTLGAETWEVLTRLVMDRLDQQPDDAAYPELAEVFPERREWLRGFADGAECPLSEAALQDFLVYHTEIERQFQIYQLQPEPSHCSGVLLAGPDGVLAGQNIDSAPPPRPEGYRFRRPRPYHEARPHRAAPERLMVCRPRTGYIADWGVANERGVACIGGGSCGVWLDERIEDTWPIVAFSCLRFADSARSLAELHRRYARYLWGRSSSILADTAGDAFVVEQSYRRLGLRQKDGHAVWSTEGYFHTPEMHDYLRAKRLDYLRLTGKHLGAGDMQYATDCAVRFTHLGELCHQPWGHGLDHLHRVLTDHSTFPRAICRHGGPDTDPYDVTVTLKSTVFDLTRNRLLVRDWVPWARFPCEVPEVVTEYPPRPR